MMTPVLTAALCLNLFINFSISSRVPQLSERARLDTALNAIIYPRANDGSSLAARGDDDGPPTCLIGNLPPTKRHPLAQPAPRAPKSPMPIQEPDEDQTFAAWIREHAEDGISTRLEIVPSKAQTNSWQIKHGNKVIPIGATGVKFPFKNKQEEFFMSGLTGCTAIIVVSSRGIYAAHLWEGAANIGGPSSFQEKRAKTGDWRKDDVVRPREEFQAIAVDIFDVATPANERRDRPLWKSLRDLQQQENSPFGDGADTHIFIMSKTEQGMKSRNRKPRYPEKVEQLATKFKNLIPGARYSLGLYQNGDRSSAEATGTILVQYSPYDRNGGDDKCTPQARVRMFYENHKTPVVDKFWASKPDQIGRIKRRDSCANNATKPTPSSPPSSGGTCKGTTDDKSVSWNLTINALFKPDECTWAEGGFGDCFPSDSVDGADDCGFSNFKHTCGPSEHPGGLVATFKTNSQCDPKIITDCIHSTLYPNGTVDACEK